MISDVKLGIGIHKNVLSALIGGYLGRMDSVSQLGIPALNSIVWGLVLHAIKDMN